MNPQPRHSLEPYATWGGVSERAERRGRSGFREEGKEKGLETRDSETGGRNTIGSGSLPAHGQPAPAHELAPDLGPPLPGGGLAGPAARGQASLIGLVPPPPKLLDRSGLCPRPHRPRCPGCLGLVGFGGLPASAPPPHPGASRLPCLFQALPQPVLFLPAHHVLVPVFAPALSLISFSKSMYLSFSAPT